MVRMIVGSWMALSPTCGASSHRRHGEQNEEKQKTRTHLMAAGRKVNTYIRRSERLLAVLVLVCSGG